MARARLLTRAAAAGLCVAALLAGCAGSDDPPSDGPSTRGTTTTGREDTLAGQPVVGPQVFTGDLQVLTKTVQALGGSITRAARSPAALREEAPTFRLLRTRVDSIVARMKSYRVSLAVLEGQRSRIVVAAPALADSLERADQLATAGDTQGFLALVPQLLISLQVTFASLAG